MICFSENVNGQNYPWHPTAKYYAWDAQRETPLTYTIRWLFLTEVCWKLISKIQKYSHVCDRQPAFNRVYSSAKADVAHSWLIQRHPPIFNNILKRILQKIQIKPTHSIRWRSRITLPRSIHLLPSHPTCILLHTWNTSDTLNAKQRYLCAFE